MNRRNHARITISILLVIFLVTPIVIQTIHSLSGRNLSSVSITKTPGSADKAGAQFLFEEKEIEEKGIENSDAQPTLIYVITRYTCLAPAESQNYFSHQRSCFGGNRPLFLTQRTLLI